MSSRQKDSGRGNVSEIKNGQIIRFLKWIGSMSCMLLLMALIGFILAEKRPETVVVYTMVIAINIIITLGSLIGTRYLMKKGESK